MGANEKHAATYHGGEYTPTTAVVRGTYAVAWDSVTDPTDIKEVRNQATAEFDRWLETVRAEAKAEALREAADAFKADPNTRDTLRLTSDWFRIRANQLKETP